MKKIILVLFTIVTCNFYSTIKAQGIHVTPISEKNNTHNFYQMMKEAFPLSFNDPVAPRFVFFTANRNFVFGVGGYIHLQALYDFNGTPNNNDFITSTIITKKHQEGGRYGITIGQSRLFFKLIGDTDLGRVTSYLEMEYAGENNTPKLQQAFFKFKGLTLGKTWSTFCDLAAGPATVDEEGPCSELAIRQPQIRYTNQSSKHIQISLALEYSTPTYIQNKNTKLIHQRIPDIPLALKYTCTSNSHIQISSILRNMYYKNTRTNKTSDVIGWGTSLSGVLKITKNYSCSFQGVYGKGIAHYMQDLSDLGYDLIPQKNNTDQLKAPDSWGGFVGFSHNWTTDLSSNIMYSYARLLNRYGLPSSSYKHAQYSAINLFWNFTEYGTCAIEYVFGRRNNFNKEYGNANRINTMIQYRF